MPEPLLPLDPDMPQKVKKEEAQQEAMKIASEIAGNQYQTARHIVGLNPDGFDWPLEAGETFVTPEAALTYSALGFTKLSHNYHELFARRLCRGKFRDVRRPVLLNSWEACYFNIDEEKLVAFARKHSVIVFISGKESSNGKVLYELCKSVNPRSYHIQTVDQIDPAWFVEGDSVGICGATSTPKWQLDGVAKKLQEL